MGGGEGRRAHGDAVCREAASYSREQRALLAGLEEDVSAQLAAKPRRLAHSLSVARTAEGLALVYGADPFLARVAGTLHDWSKALTDAEQLALARELGIEMGVDLTTVTPLLHGIIAARTLPARYPALPPEVWRAIEVHTTAAVDMSPLDQIIFVADGIEPLRGDTPGIARTRSLVGRASLDDLFWEAFVGGIVYVLEGGRHLYPGTVDVYNELAARRAANDKASKETACQQPPSR